MEVCGSAGGLGKRSLGFPELLKLPLSSVPVFELHFCHLFWKIQIFTVNLSAYIENHFVHLRNRGRLWDTQHPGDTDLQHFVRSAGTLKTAAGSVSACSTQHVVRQQHPFHLAFHVYPIDPTSRHRQSQGLAPCLWAPRQRRCSFDPEPHIPAEFHGPLPPCGTCSFEPHCRPFRYVL